MRLLFRVFVVLLVIGCLGALESQIGMQLELETAGQTQAPTEPFYVGAN